MDTSLPHILDIQKSYVDALIKEKRLFGYPFHDFEDQSKQTTKYLQMFTCSNSLNMKRKIGLLLQKLGSIHYHYFWSELVDK